MAFSDHVARADQAVRDHLGSVTVTYAPAVGDAVEVAGMFDAVYVLPDQGHANVEQVTPAVWLKLEDLPTHPEDDEPTLTIAGNTYRVSERQPDGLGTVRLLLHRTGA
jgi:anti-sigma factor ChrR (cupin superfamily)